MLHELNESQAIAVKHTDGPVLVIAGAGSGKTRVLTYRIAYLLSKGVPSQKILALTFTNKAAAEMKERIISLVGMDKAQNLWMGTFHSIFSKILRYEASSIGFDSNYTIYDAQDSKNLISKIITDLNLDREVYKPGLIASKISNAKNNLITPEIYLQNNDFYKQDSFQKIPQTGTIYKAYVNRCKISNAMDFDDLLLQTNILFRDFPDILQKYQKRFSYILVDEFQDTNTSQNLIVKKLALPENNICVVGDDAQSIYSFRGAKIENILNFSREYPNHQLFKLEQNYRSTQTIVNAANSIILKNSNQIKKNTFSEQEIGTKIKVIENQTDLEEGIEVAKLIHKNIEQGSDYNECAILYRTNAQSRIFEEALTKFRIPCRIYGGLSFFQRKEIKDVLAYIRICINPKDEEALGRIINYPARGIGNTTVEKLELLAQRNSITIWDVLSKIELAHDIFNKATITKLQNFYNVMLSFIQDIQLVDAYSLVNRIIEKTGIHADLKADSSIEGQSRLENVEELLNGIKEFTEEQDNAYLPEYLEKIALLTDLETDLHEKLNKVTLMTIHSAKGLEFKHCYIVGLEENLFPSQLSIMSPKELEEERRLFYVALTRAKQSVVLSFATSRRKWGNLNVCTKSRFINEIDPNFIETTDGLPRFQSFNPIYSKDKESYSENSKPLFQNFRKQPNNKLPKIEDFIPDNPQTISQGDSIIHATFGRGIVKEIKGVFPDSIATIHFSVSGEKKLLLKFAKLKRVDI